MRFYRYRKPSLKTALGITRAKRRVNKALGITDLMKPFRTPGNFERRVKRRLGYYSTPAKMIRHGGPPTPLGCLLPIGVVTVILIVTLLATVAFSHSGGLDQCGGHNDRKNGGYHVHNWTNYYNCYGWPEDQVDPLKELRQWLDKTPKTARLVSVRSDLQAQAARLDKMLCNAVAAGDKDTGLAELIKAKKLVCSK